MSALFRRDQLCDVTHDLVTDLIELLAVLLPMALCLEGTKGCYPCVVS